MDEDLFTYESRRRFARHYIPTLLWGMFLTGASTGCMSIIAMSTYLSDLDVSQAAQWVPAFVMCSSILTVYSGFMVARGWSGWVWVKVTLLIFCFLAVMPAFAYRINGLLYCLGLLFPLIGLFILNTTRHREFRQKCLEFRHQREACGRELKAQRLLENKRAAFRVRRQEARARKALRRKSR